MFVDYFAAEPVRVSAILLLARFDAMGGAMEIESRVGHGTQVTVTSPPEPVTSLGEQTQNRTADRSFVRVCVCSPS